MMENGLPKFLNNRRPINNNIDIEREEEKHEFHINDNVDNGVGPIQPKTLNYYSGDDGNYDKVSYFNIVYLV
jgi:hypothetical protein